MPAFDYIPSPDADFRTWAEAFRDGIDADPAKYFLTPADAATITSVVDDFVAKLAIASNEATRTSPTIADKDDARNTCEELLRQYAIDIKNNEGITDGDKIAVGVRPINPNREPIDAPGTSPLLNILGATPGNQTLRYADSLTPDSRSKPFGVIGLELYRGITEDGEAALSACQFIGLQTRNPIDSEFDETQDGKMATYYARWVNGKGEQGPWSLPVSMRVAA